MTRDEAKSKGWSAEFHVLQNGTMTPFAYARDLELEEPATLPGKLPESPILRGVLCPDAQFKCDAISLLGTKTEFSIVSLEDSKESATFTGFFLKLSPIDGKQMAFVMRQSD